jgi:hypothetical protein
VLKRPLAKSALLAIAILALALGVAACGGDDDSASEPAAEQSEQTSAEDGAGGSITVDLAEQNGSDIYGSGISGTATLTETSGTLDVFVALDGDDGSSPRPIHIHAGTCEELGDVVYGLTDVMDGSSSSTVEAILADLEGEFAINAHESADAIESYIACGPVN